MARAKRNRKRGFTLVELMVVAALMAVLLVAAVPAVRGLMQSNSMANAENLVRATLITARTYAMKHHVAAGVRFQQDGHMVVVYASNYDDVINPDDYMNIPIYEMKAAWGIAPAKLPDPWRVTTAGLGYDAGSLSTNAGHLAEVLNYDPADGYYAAAPEWTDEEHAWMTFPLVVFSPRGKVILPECTFSGSSSDPWYPTLEGAFGKCTTAQTNDNPDPGHDPLRYTDQGGIVGWVCNSYKNYNPHCSHWVRVEAPTVTSLLRIFDYEQFKAANPPSMNAIEAMLATRSDLVIDVNTGQVVRSAAFMEVEGNN